MDTAGPHLTDAQTRQLRDLWGDQLKPIPADLLGPHVPWATRVFLTTVGLPAVTVRMFKLSFIHDHRLSSPVTHAGRDYLVVAEEGWGKLPYLVDSRSEELREEGFRQAGPGRLINSSLGHFVLFLGEYIARIGDPPRVTWQEADAVAADLREQLRISDPASVASANCWWNVIFDEIDRSGD